MSTNHATTKRNLHSGENYHQYTAGEFGATLSLLWRGKPPVKIIMLLAVSI